MFNWISNTVVDIAEWVGSGLASLIEWLLGGLADMFTLIFDAADGIWNVFESLWGLSVGFVESLHSAFTVLCPFIPEPVLSVIGAGLLVIVIAGIVKKVRGQ